MLPIALEIMKNYPECNHPWARCVSARFSDGRYDFVKEGGERVTITAKSIAEAIEQTVLNWTNEECYFDGIMSAKDFQEPEKYDAIIIDYVVQIALYGAYTFA